MTSSRTLKILLLAHDLSDAAVRRRVAMLREGGAEVTIAGFRRTPEPIHDIAGSPAINLGQTYSAGFVQRILSVLREVVFLKRHQKLFKNADVIIARNLEMLAIGVRGRSMCAPGPTLVYECLDIHRLLLGRGPVSIALRALEGWLTRRASALITSSPAFVKYYFDTMSKVRLPVRYVENKILKTDKTIAPQSTLTVRPEGPPWIIGWFGIIRCRKSLQILTDLVRQSNGAVEVVIRGRPALHEFDDFNKQVNETPGLRFLGPYKSPDDLATIYQGAHFTWAIDMFEEGLNSSWLLPNRLYEGGFYGSVPIAMKSVETGRFLKNLGIGVLIEDATSGSLIRFFKDLSGNDCKRLESAVLNTPQTTWVYGHEDCKALVLYLGSFNDKKFDFVGDRKNG